VGKAEGMVVTFRKPATMTENVRNAIKLFSNEARDWEKLVPREYKEVKQDFQKAYKSYQVAQEALEKDPTDFKKKVAAIKTFQELKKLDESIKSYEGYADEYAEDSSELAKVSKIIRANVAHIENIKAEVKHELEEQNATEDEIEELFKIEFSADQRATHAETIDSYYISKLLKDANINAESKRKLYEIVNEKPIIVKEMYDDGINEAGKERTC
jgi:type I restriction enzyme R subunit